MSSPFPDPINPQQTDAVSGSVFSGDKTGLTRGSRGMSGRWTFIEAILAAIVVVGFTAMLIFWLF
jgi:hypothetical protein